MRYSFRLDSYGLTAGTLRFFKIKETVNQLLGEKLALNSKMDYGTLVEAMILRLCKSSYRGLWSTRSFDTMPLELLLATNVKSTDLDRFSLASTLDAISNFGAVPLYLMVASKVFKKLGLTVEEVHIDSTSFHYDGKTREETACLLQARMGYSRDHRPDLNQFIELFMVEPNSGLPVFAKSLSGNISDKTSFFETASNELKLVQRQFQDLSFFVGDSAACTANTFKAVTDSGLNIVTRPPDNLSTTKSCYNYAAKHKAEFVPLGVKGRNNHYSGLWVPNITLFEYPVKALVLRNDSKRESVEATIRRNAAKEQARLTKAVKKLRTQPAKCEPDAQTNLRKLQKTCKLTTIKLDDVIKKYDSRGRPTADGEKKVKSVAFVTHVELDEQAIADKIHDEMMFTLVTTDTKRNWDMVDLKGIYSRQSLVERDWRLAKDPRILLDAFFLNRPSRINALLWLVSISLLLMLALEYLANERCREYIDQIPQPDGSARKAGSKLSFIRMRDFFDEAGITILLFHQLGLVHVDGITEVHKGFLSALGPEWSQLYDPDHIRKAICPV